MSLREAEKREAIANGAAADAVHEMQKWRDLADAANTKVEQAEGKGKLLEERVGELETQKAVDAISADRAKEAAGEEREKLKQQVLNCLVYTVVDPNPRLHP
jgi:hypothetical protein